MASQSNLKEILADEIQLLDRALIMLQHSFGNCEEIGVKNEYDLDEYEKFEALSSRFARTCDIFIQKLLRLIDEIDLESPGTIRDRINRAAKKELSPVPIRSLTSEI